jgi:Tfp pilus assembly protein PilF
VRLGIAACYYRAGKLDAATAAYNRVLQLDANSADALLGLAIIKFGSNNAQEVRGLCWGWLMRCHPNMFSVVMYLVVSQ